jgi:hypothetical protein
MHIVTLLANGKTSGRVRVDHTLREITPESESAEAALRPPLINRILVSGMSGF